jgi:hypothetical protein
MQSGLPPVGILSTMVHVDTMYARTTPASTILTYKCLPQLVAVMGGNSDNARVAAVVRNINFSL